MCRIRRIIAAKPDRVILRAKELTEADHFLLNIMVAEYCDFHGVKCTLHGEVSVGADSVHLPMAVFRQLAETGLSGGGEVGVSVHSVGEAVFAEKSGVDYVVAGHIFATGCKPDLPPRGVEFLRKVCGSVRIPVYAIGGINERNIAEIRDSGAAGACLMSGFMRCEDPVGFLEKLRERVR